MKKNMIIITLLSPLIGCAPKGSATPQDFKSGSDVFIYSESSVASAQDRANRMCGSHAYFIVDLREKNPKPFDPKYAINFNCDVKQASELGNSDAYKIQQEKAKSAYQEYIGEMQRLKEARRKRADPNKYESYTETDPDGTVRSYNFFNGKSCEVNISSSGNAGTYCE